MRLSGHFRYALLTGAVALAACAAVTPLARAEEAFAPSQGETSASQAQTAVEGAEVAPAADYDAFLSALKVLEAYAGDYAATNPGMDSTELVINYIRTGIEKYNSDSWAILAGPENTEFVSYVAQRDTEEGTTAQSLRGIGTFETPNGQTVEFGHLFGALNIAYYSNTDQGNADFGSWAGDICDLRDYSTGQLSAPDVEERAQDEREN